ncbi:MAG: restriction endonuclease subunit S [Treponema sp.]|nr:restriction endonuclease subunit S [Treponema sp.]
MAKKENRHAELVSASANIEAPYELPEGWKWEKGESLFKPMESTLPKGDYFSYIDIESIDNTNQTVFSPKQLPCKNAPSRASRKLHAGDTVFSMVRPYLKNIAYIDSSLADSIASTGFFVCTPRESVDGRYVYNLMKSPYVVDGLNALMKGDNSPSIRKSDIEGFHFPLPPTLAEQKRIVNRIETMFAKLDQAQEKAQSVLDSFETRKAAILHKAFTGQLTANWRKKNGVSDDSWEEKTVGECCSEVKVGIVIKPTRYYTEEKMGIPAFRSANVRENHIDDFDWVYINAEGMKKEKRSIVHTNDVLVVRSGAPGTACVVTEQFDGYNAIDILIAVPLQVVINSYFLCYYTNSPMGKNIVAEKKRGLGLTHFNVKGYSATPIRIPSLSEQKEIVRILDTVLEKENYSKEAAQTVLDQIALLKKSILARAFRGEL